MSGEKNQTTPLPANQPETEVKEVKATSGKASGNSKKKRPLWLRILFIVLESIAAILVALILFRDIIIETAVEQFGSRALGTKVNIVDFDTSLLGTVELTGFTVKNPDGYHGENAFKLDKVFIDISVPSLFTSKIEVLKIYVSGMRVDFEVGFGKTNLGELQKNVNTFVAKLSGSDTGVDEEVEPDVQEKNEASAKQVVIRDLCIENYAVEFGAATLPLVPVHMTDIGDGQPINETFNQLYDMMLKAVVESAGKAGGAIVDGAGKAGKAVVDGASKTGKALVEAGKGLFDVFSRDKKK